MALPDWLSTLGSNAYSWVTDNPLQALSLGAGAVGTGMGIYEQQQAGEAFKRAQREAFQRSQERQKLAEQFATMDPRAFAPTYSPAQLQAMYFRPAAQNMAERGQTQGGAFRQALADAALKAEADRVALGNQIYQTRLSALSQGQPAGPTQTMPATGTTGAFGGSLQNLMLMQALRGQAPRGGAMPQSQQGAAWGTGVGADVLSNRGYGSPAAGMDVPNYQLYGGGGNWGGQAGDQRYSLTPFGQGQFYPDEVMSMGSMAEMY